ncbi:hypothetical protein AB0M43_33725 [Longispora sp. NPDC051575]|uniref:hypothetical protein n=1 Tax=Longispora sp. NPDC051575 TaxID=3154943 RepID=UPI00341DC00C
MFNPTPDQRKELGGKIRDFLNEHPPTDVDAVLFVDDHAAGGYSAGPDVPAGCRLLVRRDELDMIAVTNAAYDVDSEAGRDALVELVLERAERQP